MRTNILGLDGAASELEVDFSALLYRGCGTCHSNRHCSLVVCKIALSPDFFSVKLNPSIPIFVSNTLCWSGTVSSRGRNIVSGNVIMHVLCSVLFYKGLLPCFIRCAF